ncbi:AMP-binding protein [Amycolatopsis acidiphila]|uniref:AMP-binding protein n=1 Tax=Amycolatopsis acidiphila TaxID=715473 RepID=A0A558AP70_9PSEU|nr:AMP-binding protein [Amycolatopsis acidiphila]TVT26061.1 AMP-binding protein [Amycolatopsis acidiphila]UIJ63217.1 AMP-binding protein [Amycolatopsis acidiphila]GHG74406.1 cyclohexanecarboxylate-CoA ligase [Amycolatopsis acidiphila]
MTPGYLRATGIWELVARRAALTPDAVLAYDERRRRLTFGELKSAAERAAAGLAERGVGRGTVVSWQLPSRFTTIVLTVALSRLGAVQNPLIMMLREPEVRFICEQAGSALLIVPSEFRGFSHHALATSVARELPGLDVLLVDGELPEGDPAALPPVAPEPEVRWLFYTSGTTSAPKGARHRDAGLIAASATYCAALRPRPEDRIAGLAPIAHVGGVLHVLSAVQAGCSLVITDVFTPQETGDLLSELGVTLGGNGVPFARMLIRRQLAEPGRRLFPQLRAFLVGGAPRTPQLHRQVRDVLGGIGIVSGYGLTECPYVAWGSLTDGDERHATTEGRAGPGTELRIVREDGTPADPGEPGELWVRAAQLCLGYVDPASNAEAFDESGFFRTGDLATVDAQGYLTITGRLKDVIIRNMENISAREVEDHLLGCAGVADAAVIGVPDPDTGERVCAVVVPDGPPPELAGLCAQLLARGLNKRKLPERLEVVAELPRNAMNKVVKRELRDAFRS